MADENKPETGAKPEELSDQDLTDVVGGVRAVRGGVMHGSTRPGRTGAPAAPASSSGNSVTPGKDYWDSYERAKDGGFGE